MGLVFEAADDNLFIRKGSKPPPRDSFFMGGVDEDEPVEEDLSRSRPQNQRFNKSSNTNDKFKSDKFANKAPFGKVRHFDVPKVIGMQINSPIKLLLAKYGTLEVPKWIKLKLKLNQLTMKMRIVTCILHG